MMFDYCVVYPYLNARGLSRDTVLQNYYSHVVANPGIPVVPVSIRDTKWVPETVIVDNWLSDSLHTSKLIFFPDQLFFAYLRSPHRLEAKHYVLVDWDTFSFGVNFPEFLREVWDADLGGGKLTSCCEVTSIFWCGRWCGCSQFEVLSYETDCIFCFSRQAALKLSIEDPEIVCRGFRNAYMSVRLPTMAAFWGFQVRGDPRLGSTLTAREVYNFPEIPAVYHSVRVPFSLTNVAYEG